MSTCAGKIIQKISLMPLFFQQDIDDSTKLGIWKIDENEGFFLQQVPLQREITHPHKRLQHLAGRFLLKNLFPHFPVELIKIADTNKPFLENESYHFSISHCNDYAAVIVSKKERVGVDVEIPSFKIHRIKNKFLSQEELKMFEDANSLQTSNIKHQTPNAKLTLMWCCKEAVYKWWSYGGVDFSEKIKLQPFQLQPCGNLSVHFLLGEKNHLSLHYKIFDNLCMAWLKT